MTEPIHLPERWTPVYETLVKELGVNIALVYGAIWRFCQMRENICRASLETLASRSGLSRRTVIRHVKTLVRHGYITDLTPDLKHAPHAYVNSREAGIPPGDFPPQDSQQPGGVMPEDVPGSDSQAVEECQDAHSGVTGRHSRSVSVSPVECQRVTGGVTPCHPGSDSVSLQECQRVTGGVTPCHPNKTLLRESLREYLRDERRDTQAPKFSKPSKTLLEALGRKEKELERDGNQN